MIPDEPPDQHGKQHFGYLIAQADIEAELYEWLMARPWSDPRFCAVLDPGSDAALDKLDKEMTRGRANRRSIDWKGLPAQLSTMPDWYDQGCRVSLPADAFPPGILAELARRALFIVIDGSVKPLADEKRPNPTKATEPQRYRSKHYPGVAEAVAFPEVGMKLAGRMDALVAAATAEVDAEFLAKARKAGKVKKNPNRQQITKHMNSEKFRANHGLDGFRYVRVESVVLSSHESEDKPLVMVEVTKAYHTRCKHRGARVAATFRPVDRPDLITAPAGTCEHCGAVMPAADVQRRTCSDRCRKALYRKRAAAAAQIPDVAYLGAMADVNVNQKAVAA